MEYVKEQTVIVIWAATITIIADALRSGSNRREGALSVQDQHYR